jgi:hypothetical protein
MVNGLLTITIKVNIPASAESNGSRGNEDDEEADSRVLDLVAGRRLGRLERLTPKRVSSLSGAESMLYEALVIWRALLFWA